MSWTPLLHTRERLEPNVKLLAFLVLVFGAALLVVSKWSPDDGQTFQVFSGLVSGFAGALLLRVKPDGAKPPEIDAKNEKNKTP